MGAVRPMTCLDIASIQQVLDDAQIEPLSSLSQRKLNALGLPLAYVDRQQRYRLVNTAFLDCVAKPEEDVVGHTVFDVWGHDIYQLYQAYIEAALSGECTGFVRQLSIPGQPAIWIRVEYYPDRSPNGTVRGFLATYSDVDYLKRLELEAGQRTEHGFEVGELIFVHRAHVFAREAIGARGRHVGGTHDVHQRRLARA